MAQEQQSGGPAGGFCSNCGKQLEANSGFCPSCGTATGGQAASVPAASGGAIRTDHIKHRNMIMQVVLAIVTLGIYTIYWYYVTLEEMQKANGKTEGAGIWTLLSIIPIANLFAQWHYSFEYAEFNGGKYPGIAIFILWIVFAPVVWFLVQTDLNRAATR
jgi:hypothetical protein